MIETRLEREYYSNLSINAYYRINLTKKKNIEVDDPQFYFYLA
jgi:translation elongation factor EF-4